MAIETALISAPSRAGNPIFGRPLLERLIISCKRAGIKRIFIEAPAERRDEVAAALGERRDDPSVVVVDRIADIGGAGGLLEPSEACIALRGNLVFLKSQLARVLADADADRGQVIRLASADYDRGGEIATGPVGMLLRQAGLGGEPLKSPAGALPFALNGRPEDREEAELRLARSLREESAATDTFMARMVDRHFSWRISYRLARTRITPNQVTITNTLIGFFAAWMFAQPSYGWRLAGSLLFLLSITIDGVDGELARLKMRESVSGGRLDVITDNLVHVAIFAGVFLGCYRADHTNTFLYLMGVQLGGFALAALATYLAFTRLDDESWLQSVDRWTGRDFAYALVAFALVNRLEWFCWGTAFGTYIFAFALLWLTARRRNLTPLSDQRREESGVSAEGQ